MSSKLRLNDISLSDLDMNDELFGGDNTPRVKQKPKTRADKRQAIDNYMEARELKRNIDNSYSL